MILDANRCGDFISNNADMGPVRRWIDSGVHRLIYSNQEKIQDELYDNREMKKYLEDRFKFGRARRIEKEKVEQAIKDIETEYSLRSDDPHILGLAIASGAKLLCTQDENLEKDFKKIVKGKIYKNKTHAHLLTDKICKP
ncbi:MAG: hypothetical protein OXB86_06920 [Bdellovibrionales bacterium]|nr:hypothetical protein [Bdellovibrionales bacterium]